MSAHDKVSPSGLPIFSAEKGHKHLHQKLLELAYFLKQVATEHWSLLHDDSLLT